MYHEVGHWEIDGLIYPEQNGHHFAQGIFKCIFMSEHFNILIQISLKFFFQVSNW